MRPSRPGKKGKGKSLNAKAQGRLAHVVQPPPPAQPCLARTPPPAMCRPSTAGLRLPHSSARSGTPGKASVGCFRRPIALDCFEPFDLDRNQAHNILDNAVFEALLKLCWSGIIALIMLAPPCKEYSRLKFRPGRPKALRTPQMNGVPGLSPSQLKRLQDSQAIHERGRALFIAVVSKGGIGVWEQPPSALSWLEEANFHMLRKHQYSLVWVDAWKNVCKVMGLWMQ